MRERMHPISGKKLIRGTRWQTVQVEDFSRRVLVRGWYSDDDSDSIHEGKDLQETNEIYKELQKIVDEDRKLQYNKEIG